MKSRTQVLIAFFSAMAVTLVAVSDVGRTSPGGLATVHQRMRELAGRNDCSECHGGLFGTMREACLECHEPIAAQLAEGSGLHGTLGARAEQCGLCHAEHHGANAPLVQGQSFALAGVGKVAEFDHARIGFAMDGAHLALECKACHVNATVAVLPQGAQRYLGLAQDCATCHADVHEGRFAAACASCHGQTSWDGLFSLGHERFLPLIGAHALACDQCHQADGAHALERVAGRDPRPEARDCAACHESPHGAEFTAGTAVLAGLPEGAACASCHAAEHTTFRDPALAELTPAQHAAAGFALLPPHDAPACADCHAPQRKRFDRRYPGRTPEQCSACHEDVHEGQFERGPFAGEECSTCHEPLHFVPAAFGVELHARAELPLEGQHAEIACEDCHEKPDEEHARVFRGTPSDCDACHDDAHAGFFTAFVAGLLPPAHGECARCHDASSFAAAEAGFEHGRFTDFEVLGAHSEAGCAACHAARAERDENGRSFGSVAQDFGPFAGCVTCHADPHAGRFDEAFGYPAEVEGFRDCARCHDESSFRSLPRGFEHDYWTGFALSGAHGAASCAACHEPLAGPDRLGRTAAEAAGASCADCHEDPHGGQFDERDRASDCARCHASEPEDFLVFDHERDARFALGEAHRALECASCHMTIEGQGLAFVRYRPLGRECVDCHGSNAEVLLRRQPRKR